MQVYFFINYYEYLNKRRFKKTFYIDAVFILPENRDSILLYLINVKQYPINKTMQ